MIECKDMREKCDNVIIAKSDYIAHKAARIGRNTSNEWLRLQLRRGSPPDDTYGFGGPDGTDMPC